MSGFDTNDGYRIAPLDSAEARFSDEERQSNEGEEYEIDPILSSPDFHFSEEDPAKAVPRRGTPAELATFDPRKDIEVPA